MELIRTVLAGVGATLIIGALAFVTVLIGVLVNAMVILMAGPLVDRVMKES